MQLTLLKAKIHRAVVTGADLNYEGSIGIDPHLLEKSGIKQWEKVDIYNITNGNRFSTYVIKGNEGEVSLNGAAARLVHKDDLIIIAAYGTYSEEEAETHNPTILLMNDDNTIKEIL